MTGAMNWQAGPRSSYKEKVIPPPGRFRPASQRRRRSRLLLVLVFVAAMYFLPIPFIPRLDFSSSRVSAPRADILQYIDPLIGTTDGGHVFPGASLPYGMAKAVADTLSPAENAAGYVSDANNVLGFSHMHDSGTGGSPSLGNFPLFVHPGCPDDDFEKCKYTSKRRAVSRVPGSPDASPGYFSIELSNSVTARMTVTEHAALYNFSFPASDRLANGQGTEVPYSPLVLLDLSDLAGTRSHGAVQVDPESGRITGDGTFRPSFGAGDYRAYVCADFAGAAVRKTGTFVGEKAQEERKVLDGSGNGFSVPTGSAGAWVQFERPPADEILARVGVSFMSAGRACENAEREIPDFDFNATVGAAEDAWADKLSVVEVDATGVDEELQTVFWSGIYRTMLSPQNYTGENPLWNSTEPYYDSFYCIWDSFRAQHPLLTILDPVAQTEMVRALIDIYRYVGKLPDCRMSFCKGYTQGGSNADVVITDAFLKNLTDGVDWDTAYEAVVSDAEDEPRNWGVEGRGNLVSYHALGYIPWDDKDSNGTGPMSRTISRTVEYAYDDFCIGLLARGLGGREADAAKYLGRGANWRKLWKPAQRDLYRTPDGQLHWTEFEGFLQPRMADGTFRYHNTRLCSPVHQMHRCYYDTHYDTYEGSPWLYSFFVPQDMAALAEAMGGRAALVRRLSFFHESGIVYMGNEQSFLPTYQFHYGGRPGLSSYWAHRYIPGQFNTSLGGLPGNDDCAMGAFTAFALMGFFPVAGQDVYLLAPPFFPEVRVRARNGRWAVLRVRNFDPDARAIYVQSATLDGRPYTRSWITHDFFMRGGLLEFEVGTEEGGWGTAEEDLPPSYPQP